MKNQTKYYKVLIEIFTLTSGVGIEKKFNKMLCVLLIIDLSNLINLKFKKLYR